MSTQQTELQAKDIWRLPSFMMLEEACDWVQRAWANNDAEDMLNILDEIEEFIKDRRTEYRNAMDKWKEEPSLRDYTHQLGW